MCKDNGLVYTAVKAKHDLTVTSEPTYYGKQASLTIIDDYPETHPWTFEEKKEPMLNTNILLKIDIAVTLILIAVLVIF